MKSPRFLDIVFVDSSVGLEVRQGRRSLIVASHTRLRSKAAGRARSLKKALLKTECDAVIEAYKSPDKYNLPAGNTKWRLSNAITWVAGKTEDAEHQLDLMKLAGDVLPAKLQLLRAAQNLKRCHG